MRRSKVGKGPSGASTVGLRARYGWFAGVVLVVGLAACQVSRPPSPLKVFHPLVGLDGRAVMRIVLINSLQKDPPDFSAMYYSFIDGPCSSFLVGTKVLLAAKHCVPEGGGEVTVPAPSKSIKGYCTPSQVVDLALCALQDEPPGAIHETINSDGNLLHLQQMLLLSGFGCTQPHGGGTGDSEFRIGLASISRLPTGQSDEIETTGGAALCGDDSGAPAFAIDAAAVSQPLAPGAFTRRLVVGVNSHADENTISGLVSTSAQTVQDFFQYWTDHNPGFKICGYSSGAERCRAPPQN